jgi:hypothetical protein
MISNERSWPHLRRPYQKKGQGSGQPQPRQPYPHSNEDTIKSAEISIERKLFLLALKENARGRFLRITEDGGSKHSTVIVPVSGLDDFSRLLNEMLTVSEGLPAKDVDSAGNR